jgi:hypothetical protein
MQRLRREGVDLENDVLDVLDSGAIQRSGDDCADRQPLDVVCDGLGQPERQRPFLVVELDAQHLERVAVERCVFFCVQETGLDGKWTAFLFSMEIAVQGVGLVEESERQPDLAQAGLSNRVLSKQNDNRLVSGVRRG